jgi:hypothetical protein
MEITSPNFVAPFDIGKMTAVQNFEMEEVLTQFKP